MRCVSSMKLIIFVSFIFGVMAFSGVVLGLDASRATAQSPLAAPTGLTARNGSNPGGVNVRWNSVPGSNYYRIGWIADADYLAAGDDWLERFAFVDVTPKTSYTITRLTPGEPYWFIVASTRERYGANEWSSWTSLTLTDVQSSCPTDFPAPSPVPGPAGDYDADNDGLIEVSGLAQLDGIRYDLDGDGASRIPAYHTVFPNAREGMGCPNDGGCRGYELVVDLDFDTNGNGRIGSGDAYWDNGKGWKPIGPDSVSSFSAVFDGGGHTISNLYIDRPAMNFIGLFGVVKEAHIVNVGMVEIKVTGKDNVGGLVGRIEQSGEGNTSISNSYATGRVTGEGTVGGLVGVYRSGGIISGSYATSDVTGSSNVGGLVGYNSTHVTISDSYATGNVTGRSYVGGLGGTNHGSIRSSHATGDVTGLSNVGGLVGYNSSNGTISDSYATGDVSGYRFRGSLVGRNAGNIINSSGSGTVTG